MPIDTSGVDLSGCQSCTYRIKSQEEAAVLLQGVIRQAHMKTIKGGGLLLEARLDPDTVMRMCLWEAMCEDCEAEEDGGDSPEPNSQGAE